jgi:HNH endonuclease
VMATLLSDNRPYETKGQHLAWYIQEHHLPLTRSNRLLVEQLLEATSNAPMWTQAFHQMAVLHCVRRLVAGAKVVCDPYSDLDDPVVDRELGQIIVDTMGIDIHSVSALRARLLPAVRAARSRITPETRQIVRAWAEREFPLCFLCSAQIDFSDEKSWSLDHVWPRAYGGDSDEENLLPACQKCNEDKADKADWPLYPIQGNVPGHLLDSAEMDRLPRQLRFAVVAYYVSQVSTEDRISLRDAYIKSAPFSSVRVIDRGRPVDIFNLEPTS